MGGWREKLDSNTCGYVIVMYLQTPSYPPPPPLEFSIPWSFRRALEAMFLHYSTSGLLPFSALAAFCQVCATM